MRQFDVFANPSRRPNPGVLFVLVLQSDQVSDTTSVVVASLVADVKLPGRLYPAFEVSGRQVILSITDIASIPRSVLDRPVANLESERDRIVAALDRLFLGY